MAEEIPPSPAPVPPAPTPSPAPAPSYAAPAALPPKRYTGLAVTSWILILLTALLAVVPVFGFGSWILALIVIPLVLIFAAIILSRGGTAQGIFLIAISVVLLPCFLFLAPLVSTLVLGASLSAKESAQEQKIITNLNRIDSAKSQWASQTNAAPGTAPAMSDLAKFIDGGQVTTVVGETYEPKAIGEKPVAKLPPHKSLASHKAGEEITAGAASAVPSASAAAESPSPSPSASSEEE